MKYKLFYFLLGCKLPNRHTEQHDVYFGIAEKASDLIPAIQEFWPDAQNLHIDCWREVTNVDGFTIKVEHKSVDRADQKSLFFLNLGGYRRNEFEEFHFKELLIAGSQAEAVKKAKQTSFYKQYGFKGAVAHIDNTYGVDIDEIYPVADILLPSDREKFSIIITDEIPNATDTLHLGYTTLAKLKNV